MLSVRTAIWPNKIAMVGHNSLCLAGFKVLVIYWYTVPPQVGDLLVEQAAEEKRKGHTKIS